MARPLDLERRSELVQRALEVLRTNGGRMTMTELARALGIKRPTLYFYFRDLTGLLHAAVEDVYRHNVGHLLTRVAAVEHPVAALGELARAAVELQRGRRDLVLLLLQLWAAGGSDPEELLSRARAATAPLRAALVARLAAGLERGVVAPCEPARVVDLTMAVIDGVLVQQVTRGAAGEPVVEELWHRVLAPLMLAEPADVAAASQARAATATTEARAATATARSPATTEARAATATARSPAGTQARARRSPAAATAGSARAARRGRPQP